MEGNPDIRLVDGQDGLVLSPQYPSPTCDPGVSLLSGGSAPLHPDSDHTNGPYLFPNPSAEDMAAATDYYLSLGVDPKAIASPPSIKRSRSSSPISSDDDEASIHTPSGPSVAQKGVYAQNVGRDFSGPSAFPPVPSTSSETSSIKSEYRPCNRRRNESAVYKCTHTGCDKTFPRDDNRKRHEELHKGVKFLCPICTSPSTREDNRLTHVNRHKMGTKICKVCGVPVGDAGMIAHFENGGLKCVKQVRSDLENVKKIKLDRARHAEGAKRTKRTKRAKSIFELCSCYGDELLPPRHTCSDLRGRRINGACRPTNQPSS